MAALAVVSASFAASAETVTATWTLGDKENTNNVSAVIAPESGLTAVMTTPLTFRQVRSITTSDGEPLSLNSYYYKAITAKEINKECCFRFTLTPEMALQLKKMTFDIAGHSTGDAQCAVYVGDQELYRTSGNSNALSRTDKDFGTRASYTHTADLTSVAASDQPVEVVLYAYARVNIADRGKEITLANVVIEAETIEGEIPVYEGEQAPLAAGTYFDLTDASFVNCRIESGDKYAVGNTRNGSSIELPFYTVNEGEFLAFLGVGLQNGNESDLTMYVDNVEVGNMHASKNDGWTSFSNVGMFPLGDLAAGQHTLRVSAATTTSYAGNWHVALYAMEDYAIGNEINLASGAYVNGIRHENGGTNVGNIKNGASATYTIFIPETGNAADDYMLEMYIRLINGGVLAVEIPEDGFVSDNCVIKDYGAAAAPALRATTPVYKDRYTIALKGLTPGVKTLKMNFSADHNNYIANYSNLSVSRMEPGQTTGIEEVSAVATDAVAVEYYNLQGVRVSDSYKGAVIRVSVDATGNRVAEKLFNR